MSLSTFILIPGSWHSSSCWQRVVPLLQTHGHRVITPDLIGTGTDHTPLSQVKLLTWVNQVVKPVQEQETAVVLVGHSRGGLIISEVAERVTEKIKLLVYLTAFLIPSGETLNSTISKVRIEHFFTQHPDGTVTIKPDKLVSVLYNTTSPEWTERILSMLAPEPAIIFDTPLHLTDDRFGRVPRACTECTQDKALLPPLQSYMYSRLPCKHVIPLSTDHSPFFSAPSELANHLHDLAVEA